MVLLQITTLTNYREIRNYNSNLDGISLVMGAMIQLVDSERQVRTEEEMNRQWPKGKEKGLSLHEMRIFKVSSNNPSIHMIWNKRDRNGDRNHSHSPWSWLLSYQIPTAPRIWCRTWYSGHLARVNTPPIVLMWVCDYWACGRLAQVAAPSSVCMAPRDIFILDGVH